MTTQEWFGEDCCGTCKFLWMDEDGIFMCRNNESEQCWAEKEPRDICDDYEEEK